LILQWRSLQLGGGGLELLEERDDSSHANMQQQFGAPCVVPPLVVWRQYPVLL